MSVIGSATSPDLNCLKGKISSLSPYAVDKTLSVEGAGADAKAVGDALESKVGHADIVNDLNTAKHDLPLSANQGVVLKNMIANNKAQTDEEIAETQRTVAVAQTAANEAKVAAEEAHAFASNALTTVEDELAKKAEVSSYYCTIPVSGWSSVAPYVQSVSVAGLLATDEPFVDVYLEDVEDGTPIIEAFALVGRISVSADNTVTVYCYEEKPTVSIPLMFKVVR